jgi:hypothetical protein
LYGFQILGSIWLYLGSIWVRFLTIVNNDGQSLASFWEKNIFLRPPAELDRWGTNIQSGGRFPGYSTGELAGRLLSLAW